MLGDGDLSRVAVHGCGGTEHDILYPMLPHLITENQGSRYIIMVVFKRLMHGLAHCLKSCKMYDRFYCFLIEHVLKRRLV